MLTIKKLARCLLHYCCIQGRLHHINDGANAQWKK